MSSSQTLTQILLLLNVIVVSISLWSFLNAAEGGVSQIKLVEEKSFAPPSDEDTHSSQDVSSSPIAVDPNTSVQEVASDEDIQDGVVLKESSNNPTQITSGGIGTTNSNGFYFVQPRQGERSFYEIAAKTGTDKVTAPSRLPDCLKNDASCTRPGCVRPECRPWGHHYDTIYQQRMGPYSRDDTDPFQFLEIGFYNGAGYDTYREFLPNGECHSIEIACIEQGPRSEGKWPWGNFVEKNVHVEYLIQIISLVLQNLI
jgi:hypothetical protein